jgi:hypothetical protein
MRTTVRLNDRLLTEAKRLAARSGRTLTAVIEEAVRETLARRGKAARRARVRLTTVKGRGVLPGVDLDDMASLLERMEGRDAAR